MLFYKQHFYKQHQAKIQSKIIINILNERLPEQRALLLQ